MWAWSAIVPARVTWSSGSHSHQKENSLHIVLVCFTSNTILDATKYLAFLVLIKNILIKII
jgi:hypothetical protein